MSAILKVMRVPDSGDPTGFQPEGISRRVSNCFMPLLWKPWTAAAMQTRLLRIAASFMAMDAEEAGDAAVLERYKGKYDIDAIKYDSLETERWRITSRLRHEVVDSYIGRSCPSWPQ